MAKASKPPLGSGKRFAAIADKAKENGAEDPDAVAAAIGMKKYGNAKMEEMAQAGKKHKKG